MERISAVGQSAAPALVEPAVVVPEGWARGVAPPRPVPPRRAALARIARTVADRGEMAFAVAGVFLLTGALLPLLLRQAGMSVDDAQGNPVLRLTYSGVHATTLLLLASRWRTVGAALRRDLLTTALVGIALLSVAWSMAPDVTLRRSFALLGTSAFGLYLATRFEPLTALRLVASGIGAAALLSAVLSVAVPSLGVDYEVHIGAWRGVYTQKNLFGQAMTFGTMAFAVLALGRQGRWRAYWAGAALCAALVVMSTSKTALAILLILAALWPLLRSLRWHPTAATATLTFALLAVGAVVVVVTANRELVFASLGRDLTLTGRTTLWAAVLGAIAERPWLGHGYSAFWLGQSGPSAAVLSAVQWETPHAHNGYLDLALDLGLVGLVVFLAGFVRVVSRAVRAVRESHDALAYWSLLFLAFMLLYNLTESTILRSNYLYWSMYVATCFTVATRRARPTAPAPEIPGISPGIRRRLRRDRALQLDASA